MVRCGLVGRRWRWLFKSAMFSLAEMDPVAAERRKASIRLGAVVRSCGALLCQCYRSERGLGKVEACSKSYRLQRRERRIDG